MTEERDHSWLGGSSGDAFLDTAGWTWAGQKSNSPSTQLNVQPFMANLSRRNSGEIMAVLSRIATVAQPYASHRMLWPVTVTLAPKSQSRLQAGPDFGLHAPRHHGLTGLTQGEAATLQCCVADHDSAPGS